MVQRRERSSGESVSVDTARRRLMMTTRAGTSWWPGRVRRAVAVVLAALLVASACSSDDSSGQADAEGRGALLGADADPVDVDAVVDRLAVAGVGVLADAGDVVPMVEPADPVSPMRLLEWQVRNLALEAQRGAGIPAVELDGALEGGTVDHVAVAPSVLVVGWATTVDSPAAAYAAELLGEDVADAPDEAVIPHLALVLFASDLAVTATGDVPSPPSRGAGGDIDGGELGASVLGEVELISHGGQVRPCSAVLDFVNGTLARVFDALGRLSQPGEVHVFGRGSFLAFLDKVLTGAAGVAVAVGNAVIDGAHLVLSTGVRVLLAPIMEIVARVAGVVGTVAHVVSFIRPWSVVVRPEPGHGEAPMQGAAQARIDLGGLDRWPVEVADCAERAGKPLPPLRPSGHPVTWDIGPASLVARDDAEPVLDADGAAALSYHSVVETGDGETVNPVPRVTITARVQRDDFTELREAIQGLIDEGIENVLGQTGGRIVSAIARPILRPWIIQAFSTLDHLRDTTGTGFVWVSYRLPDDDEPVIDGTGPDASSPTRGAVPTDCPGAIAIGAHIPRTGRYSGWSEFIFGGAEDDFMGEIPGTVSCTYTSEDSRADREALSGGLQTVVIHLFPVLFPTGEGAQEVDLANAERAWRDDTSVYATVGGRTLMVYPLGEVIPDWDRIALEITEAVLERG